MTEQSAVGTHSEVAKGVHKTSVGVILSCVPALSAVLVPIVCGCLALFRFPGFPLWKVGSLFALVVIASLFGVTSPRVLQTKYRSCQLRTFWIPTLASIPVVSYLTLYQISGLHTWRPMLDASPSIRLAASGAGFSQDQLHFDTAFHISLVQNILWSGFPSTGMHFEPPLLYHAGTHYAQAALVGIFNLDPWESNALLFDFKATAIITALLWFATWIARTHGLGVWVVFVMLGVPALTLNWTVVGNFPLWFPTLVLIIATPFVAKVVSQEHFTYRDLSLLTLVFVAVASGKIEMGLAFGALVGGWIWAKNFFDFRVSATGLLWASLLVFLGSQFSSPARSGSPSTAFSLEALNVFLVICGLAILLTITALAVAFGERGILVGLSLLVLSISISASSFRLSVVDLQSFILSAILVCFFVPASWMLYKNLRPRIQHGATGANFLTLIIATTGILNIVPPGPLFSPIVAGDLSFAELRETLVDVNQATFFTYNRLTGPSSQLTLLNQAISSNSPAFDPSLGDNSVSLALRTLSDDVGKKGLSPRNAVIYLSTEERDYLADFWLTDEQWSLSLFVKAISGFSLIYGVDGDPHGGWAVSEYPPNAIARSEHEFIVEEACFEGREVIVLRLSQKTVEFVCHQSNARVERR